MKGRIRLVALVSALAGSGLLASQAPPPSPADRAPDPTFRARVEYVEVDALVEDQDGRLVRNLQKDDFEVVEDGTKRVPIALIEEEESP